MWKREVVTTGAGKLARLRVGRRSFLKAVPAAVAAAQPLASGVGASASASFDGGSSIASAQGGALSSLGRDALKSAEQLAGLAFTAAEEDMAVAGVVQNRGRFERLRQLDI